MQSNFCTASSQRRYGISRHILLLTQSASSLVLSLVNDLTDPYSCQRYAPSPGTYSEIGRFPILMRASILRKDLIFQFSISFWTSFFSDHPIIPVFEIEFLHFFRTLSHPSGDVRTDIIQLKTYCPFINSFAARLWYVSTTIMYGGRVARPVPPNNQTSESWSGYTDTCTA